MKQCTEEQGWASSSSHPHTASRPEGEKNQACLMGAWNPRLPSSAVFGQQKSELATAEDVESPGTSQRDSGPFSAQRNQGQFSLCM